MDESSNEEPLLSPERLRMVWTLGGAVLVTGGLIILHYYANAAGAPPYIPATCALLAACTIVVPTCYLLARVYRTPTITWSMVVAAILIILPEVSSFLSSLDSPTLVRIAPFLGSGYPHRIEVENGFLMVGILVFFATFYMSIFEAEKAKERLAERSRELAARVAEQLRAEIALRESEERYRTLFEKSACPILVFDGQGRCLAGNDAALAFLECNKEELRARTVQDFLAPEEAPLGSPEEMSWWKKGGAVRLEYPAHGRTKLIELTMTPAVWQGEPVVFGVGTDITERSWAEKERARLQKQMQQAQKLESLGVLAGGIAHDFNNLLMGILGNAELAMDDLPPLSSAREGLIEIEKAAKRAADLSRQMLSYSGRGRLMVEEIHLNTLLKEMDSLLQVSASKSAVLKYELADHLPPIRADVSQVHQVVVNLVSNASEAIESGGGIITLTTGCQTVSPDQLANTYIDDNLPGGRYVYLRVADTGCGMDNATLARVFDPFFSTKFAGRGLGLAVVLGIVRGHKGAIQVESRPGTGSTFTVLFPALETPAEPYQEDLPGAEQWLGKGLILLVDDEQTVRAVGQRMVEKAGFRVLCAADGLEALALFRDHAGEIACVLLDLTMPVMDGEAVLRELQKVRSEVPVILCSGYDEQLILERFRGKGLAGVIHKPYHAAELLSKLREVLA